MGRMECQPESRQGLENRSRTTTSCLCLNFHVMVKDILKLKYVLGTKSSLQTTVKPVLSGHPLLSGQ